VIEMLQINSYIINMLYSRRSVITFFLFYY